jgi:hypothetical protein
MIWKIAHKQEKSSALLIHMVENNNSASELTRRKAGCLGLIGLVFRLTGFYTRQTEKLLWPDQEPPQIR